MKTLLSVLIIIIISVLFSNANDCAISCLNEYEKCLDQIHPGGRCRAEERLCFTNTCKFDNATRECVNKCDKTFEDCPVSLGIKCIIAERKCYTDC